MNPAARTSTTTSLIARIGCLLPLAVVGDDCSMYLCLCHRPRGSYQADRMRVAAPEGSPRGASLVASPVAGEASKRERHQFQRRPMAELRRLWSPAGPADRRDPRGGSHPLDGQIGSDYFQEVDNDVLIHDVAASAATVTAFDGCDPLLTAGTDFTYTESYPSGKTVVQLDVDGGRIGRRHPVDHAVVGDARVALSLLSTGSEEDGRFTIPMPPVRRTSPGKAGRLRQRPPRDGEARDGAGPGSLSTARSCAPGSRRGRGVDRPARYPGR